MLFSGWGTGIRTPEMSESESDALPLGDAPIFSTDDIIADNLEFVKGFFKKYRNKGTKRPPGGVASNKTV